VSRELKRIAGFFSGLTSLEKMIRLSMENTNRPPAWLSVFGIHARRYTGDNFPSIVRKMNLLSGLHELNV
jgi:hypothetical protein